ncbi:hypothetical protein KAU39_04130 [bacterium]|nr:hypothetical protein [bacterium]
MVRKKNMSENVLYIFDNVLRYKEYVKKFGENKKIFICPLTANEDYISSTFHEFEIIQGDKEIIKVPFLHYFNEKAFSEKDNYIKFIYEFGNLFISKNRNLKEYFKCPFESFSVWWFSLIAEKNTLKTDTYHRLVKLLTILDIQQRYSCNEVWLNIADTELTYSIINNFEGKRVKCNNLGGTKKKSEIVFFLNNFVKAFGYFLRTLGRLVFLKLYMFGLNSRKKILRNSKYVLFTYFPFVDKKGIKDKKFINKYYEPLQRAVEQKYKDQFIWLAMIVPVGGSKWRESVALGRKVNVWGNSLFFCEEWLKFLDFFKIIFQYSYLSIKFFLKLSYLSKKFKYLGDINIWAIFRKNWYYSFSGWVLMEGLIYYRIFDRLFHQLENDIVITYLAENHAWEKALNIAGHKRKNFKIIGIQHTHVPLLLLNYFNYKEELKEGDDIQTMPKPDYLACVGNIPAKLFKNMGWDKKRVFILGNIRFQHYRYLLTHRVIWKERKNRIIIALSIVPEEAKEVLLYAYQAFRDKPNYQILIKGHPLLDIFKLVKSLKIKMDKDIFEFVNTPLTRLLPLSKATVVTGSSAALESIASQCPVIIPRLVSTVDINPLSGITDLAVYAGGPKELRKVVDEIMTKRESPLFYEKCKKFIEYYCEFLNSDNEFLSRIERLKG